MKVLVGVDGSKYGTWATQWLARIPFATAPKVTALHVVDVISLRAPVMVQPTVLGNQPFLNAELRRLETRGKELVEETKTLLSSLQLDGKVIMKKGAVAPTILEQAPGRQGLIVLGHRGLNALDRFVLGSVSAKVAQHATCSVLVVKEPPKPVRRVLLATDGSKPADRALQFILKSLQTLYGKPGGPVEVVAMTVLPAVNNYPEARQAALALIHLYAEKLKKAGYATKEVFTVGDPTDEIIKAAKKESADLIAVGAKGLGALARFFLGSVSAKLVHHSTASVLVVR